MITIYGDNCREMNDEELKQWNESQTELDKELNKVVSDDPLQHVIFKDEFLQQTKCYKGESFNYPNTVYEYTMRFAVLAAFGGFIVEYKYKDRDKLDDQRYIKMWIDWFNAWWDQGLVMPSAMMGGVIKLNLSLYDNERDQYVTLLPDNRIQVFNSNSKQIVFSRLMPTADIATKEYFAIPETFVATDNLNHQYTPEEIDELTMQTIYSLWIFPSHDVSTKDIKVVNEQPIDLKGMTHTQRMNAVTGSQLFNEEGRMPTITYKLVV